MRRRRWQEAVIARAHVLEHEGELLCEQHRLSAPDSDQEKIRESVLAAMRDSVERARVAAGEARVAAGEAGKDEPSPRSRGYLLPAGARCDGAFVSLHAAQVLLVNLYSEEDIGARVPAVLDRLQKCLPENDQRRVRTEALFGPEAGGAGEPSEVGAEQRADRGCDAGTLAQRRAALRDAMQVGYEAQDELYAQVRSFRNILFTGTVLLTLLVAAVCVVGLLRPGAIPLCFQPSNTAGTPQASTAAAQSFVCPSTTGFTARPKREDVSIVALMGLLGGALSATFTIQKLRGTSTPYGVPVALAMLKLPAGALTAVTGLVLLYGKFVPGLSELDSQGQILAYAIVLGIAQHLVTRFVDQKAEDVLSSVPSKEGGSPATAQPPAEATQPSAATTSAPPATTGG